MYKCASIVVKYNDNYIMIMSKTTHTLFLSYISKAPLQGSRSEQDTEEASEGTCSPEQTETLAEDLDEKKSGGEIAEQFLDVATSNRVVVQMLPAATHAFMVHLHYVT